LKNIASSKFWTPDNNYVEKYADYIRYVLILIVQCRHSFMVFQMLELQKENCLEVINRPVIKWKTLNLHYICMLWEELQAYQWGNLNNWQQSTYQVEMKQQNLVNQNRIYWMMEVEIPNIIQKTSIKWSTMLMLTAEIYMLRFSFWSKSINVFYGWLDLISVLLSWPKSKHANESH